jgi:endoglucanase Acf2
MAEENAGMRKRRITMPDGRYLIFYTFGADEETKGSLSESWSSEKKTTPSESSEGESHV